MKKKLILSLTGVIVVLVIVIITFITTAPEGLAYDPADAGYCEAYGIEFDSTQIEQIYRHPETILADPDAFLSTNNANMMLVEMHAQQNDPLNLDRWTRQIEGIAELPIEDRENQVPYRLASEVYDGRETFCKIVVPHILSYMPGSAEITTTIYQTSLDPINSAFHNSRGGIVTAMSHPLYVTSEKFFTQGSAAINNITAHELFHRAYKDAWLWQIENPVENEALRFLIHRLQNEGMAVNTAYRLTGFYPNSLSPEYYLLRSKPYVRFWIGRLNRVLKVSESGTMDELWRRVSRIPDHCLYVVGGAMAVKIEDELGRDALANTVAAGPISFIQTYNTIAEDGMEIKFQKPAEQANYNFRDLRTAAVKGDFDLVSEKLDTILSNREKPYDSVVEGYLLYNIGYILLRQGQLELAERTFKLHTELFPQLGVIYVGLGDVYVEKGDLKAAVDSYELAMELDDRNQWVEQVIQILDADQ